MPLLFSLTQCELSDLKAGEVCQKQAEAVPEKPATSRLFNACKNVQQLLDNWISKGGPPSAQTDYQAASFGLHTLHRPIRHHLRHLHQMHHRSMRRTQRFTERLRRGHRALQ